MRIAGLLGKTIPVLALAIIISGCGGSSDGHSEPEGIDDYNAGYDDGFADDFEYFLGYDDGFYTVGAGPIFYQGDLIPFSPDLTYTAGFWDGQFDAYNDGYFVEYRYAFIIGFSEGYDNAYWSDYLDFLANDMHIEYLHGGFSDGYNDGFSEGRIFGAFDYEVAFPFDWMDAFLDWESGTDLYFEEVDKGTGEFGPVILFEWGVNPHELFALDALDEATHETRSTVPAMRMRKTKVEGDSIEPRAETRVVEATRPLTDEQAVALDTSPISTSRTDRNLTLTSTWLERIESIQAVPDGAQRDARTRAGSDRAR
ncbi:MAG: hypothetical protein VCD00_01160 [Candidatus Hydrogenedentota bacterium]